MSLNFEGQFHRVGWVALNKAANDIYREA
jgi:hypothetical protein